MDNRILSISCVFIVWKLNRLLVFSLFSFFLGNWSRLASSFNFTRRAGYFLIHIYAPCALIVILSWISFCIPPDATAARIALGITSVLTITTILNMLNTTMPKVWTGIKFIYSLSGTGPQQIDAISYCVISSCLISSLVLPWLMLSGLFYLILPCELVWICKCKLFPDLPSSFRLYLAWKPALELLEKWNVCQFKNSLTQTISFVSFQVSYVKAIDWYLIGSFLFVFCVLVEYTFVLYVVNVHNKRFKKIMDLQQIEEAVSNETNKTFMRRICLVFFIDQGSQLYFVYVLKIGRRVIKTQLTEIGYEW